MVLVLSYHGTYGDTTANQKIEVYEVEPGFKSDTSSCSFHDWFPPLLGSKTFQPQRLKDSVIGFNERSINQLRIKLNNSFGQLFLSQDSITGKLINSTTFKTLFRGFAIVPAVPSIGNSISFFNIADTNTKLAFYYHYPKTGSVGDTSVISNFRLADSSMSATYVRRTRTGAEINLHLAQPAAGDDPIYIQTTPGTFATIKIPDLPNISNRIIHRAELIVDQVYSASASDRYFTTPNFLYLDLKDTTYTNWYQPIPCDFNNSSGSPDLVSFGGYRRNVKDPFGNAIARYTFNLSRYVQNILTKRKPLGTLRLRAPADIYIPRTIVDNVCSQLIQQTFYPLNQPVSGRVKLGGGNNANYRMRLRLVYSRL